MKKPDHRVCPGISYIAMCGIRWQNGLHFGARRSNCEECEKKAFALTERLAPIAKARREANERRSKAYYRGGVR